MKGEKKGMLTLILLVLLQEITIAKQGSKSLNQEDLGESKRFLQSEHTCRANACEICNEMDSNRCEDCLDDYWTEVNDDGDCQCLVFVQKPNVEGICENCFAAGCSSCENGNSEVCRTCIDQTSSIRDGHCYCEEGMMMNGEGFCHACNVVGCHECSAGAVNSCESCVDTEAQLVSGQCECQKQWQKPNSFGFCSFCLVQGCASCTWDSSQCYKCLDPNAHLISGQCICPSNMPMTVDGHCQSCSVQNCASCLSGFPDKCEICANTFVKNDSEGCGCGIGRREYEGSCVRCAGQNCLACRTADNGEQICTECGGGMVQREGKCYGCDVLGCKSCGEDGGCEQCIDNDETTIVRGECICHHAHELPNSEGICQYCFNPGCISCEAQEDNRCSVCKDDSAIIKDGMCFCPEGTYIDEKEICSSCLTVGCATCAQHDPYTCIACTDTHNTTIVDGQCVCKGSSHLKPNGFGLCTYCFVDGCDSCTLDANTCYRCQEEATWVNGQCECKGDFVMVDGRCSCPAGYRAVEGSQCEEMFVECGKEIKGCEGCSEPGVCAKCGDRASVVNKVCQCNIKGQKLSYESAQCSNCFVLGCSSCADDDPQFCHVCMDISATISNGKCSCTPPMRLQPDGLCGLCQVHGCIECKDGQPSSCQTCIPGATQIAGACVCDDEFSRVNVLGECSLCLVEGCASCSLNMNVCVQCIDSRATVVGGKCSCPDGFPMNADHRCQACNVENCEYCVSDDADTCDRCGLGSLVAGRCVCSVEGQLLNTDGYCSACVVPGCKSCYPFSPHICARCEDEYIFVDGVCKCGQTNVGINENGECTSCLVDSCLSCSSADANICLVQDTSPTLSSSCLKSSCQVCYGDGEAQQCLGCQENYFVEDDGSCVRCPVLGCDVCASKFTCQTCIDSTASIVDGSCTCPQYQQPATSTDAGFSGLCSFCYVGGCAACQYANANICTKCTDDRATLSSNGCVCPVGEVLNINGICSTCRIPGCIQCSEDGNTCLSCGGQTVEVDGHCECELQPFTPNIFGVCEVCEVEGCAVCTADSDSCDICLDQSATIVEGECRCPDNFVLNSEGKCTTGLQDSSEEGIREKKLEQPQSSKISQGAQELVSQEGSQAIIIKILIAIIIVLVVIGVVGFCYFQRKKNEGELEAATISSEVNFTDTKKSFQDGNIIVSKKADTESRIMGDAI